MDHEQVDGIRLLGPSMDEMDIDVPLILDARDPDLRSDTAAYKACSVSFIMPTMSIPLYASLAL